MDRAFWLLAQLVMLEECIWTVGGSLNGSEAEAYRVYELSGYALDLHAHVEPPYKNCHDIKDAEWSGGGEHCMVDRVPNTQESSKQIEMRRPAREEKRQAPGGDHVARSMCVEWTSSPEGR